MEEGFVGGQRWPPILFSVFTHTLADDVKIFFA